MNTHKNIKTKPNEKFFVWIEMKNIFKINLPIFDEPFLKWRLCVKLNAINKSVWDSKQVRFFASKLFSLLFFFFLS